MSGDALNLTNGIPHSNAPKLGKQTLHSQTHVPIPQITTSSHYFVFRVESNPKKRIGAFG
jgi:hypothetical protein